MPVVVNEGVRIAYEASGQGRALILLHGWCGDRTWWTHAGYVDVLEREYRVLNVDLRGHGLSDKPHDPSDYSDEALIGDVLAVAGAESVERFAVWGLSFGGAIAWRVADAVPQRVPALITSGYWNPPSGGGGLRIDDPASMALFRGGLAGFIEELKKEEGENYEREFPPWAEEATLRGDAQALVAVDTRERKPLREPYGLPVPALLIAGELEDPDDEAATVAARLPNASSFRVAGVGHGGACAASALVLPAARAFLARW